MKRVIGNLLTTLAMLYSLTVGTATLYYNWDYARANRFFRWIAFGGIVSTGKALFWPYYVLHRNGTASSRNASGIANEIDRTRLSTVQLAEMEAQKVMLALNYSQQATYLLNSTPHEHLEDYPNLPDIIACRRKALEIGKAVDTGVLNAIYPELGNKFKGQFVEAVRLFLEGCESGSGQDFIRSKELNDSWADWYMDHRQEIQDATNKAIGAQ